MAAASVEMNGQNAEGRPRLTCASIPIVAKTTWTT